VPCTSARPGRCARVRVSRRIHTRSHCQPLSSSRHGVTECLTSCWPTAGARGVPAVGATELSRSRRRCHQHPWDAWRFRWTMSPPGGLPACGTGERAGRRRASASCVLPSSSSSRPTLMPSCRGRLERVASAQARLGARVLPCASGAGAPGSRGRSCSRLLFSMRCRPLAPAARGAYFGVGACDGAARPWVWACKTRARKVRASEASESRRGLRGRAGVAGTARTLLFGGGGRAGGGGAGGDVGAAGSRC